MLRCLFDDIRPEEYTPSYAGGASRMDFLLKSEQIVIETKMASASLRDRQVGEQLIIDIQRYRTHPDCKRLLCFVYDPHGNIRNPTGLETDLTRVHDKLEVKVIVVSP
jgi:REase_DpnII-MboI